MDLEDDKIDYEIRFYSSHTDAVQQGTKYADNIVGVDGCVSKDCALWKEDLKHRVMLAELGVASFHAGSGKVIPKYYNYVIYGNMILLCPGWNDEDAMQRCSNVINDLTSSVRLRAFLASSIFCISSRIISFIRFCVIFIIISYFS